MKDITTLKTLRKLTKAQKLGIHVILMQNKQNASDFPDPMVIPADSASRKVQISNYTNYTFHHDTLL